MKYSPDPWRADELAPLITTRDKDGNIFAVATVVVEALLEGDYQANQHLIASAPDLLKACEARQLYEMRRPNPFGHDCDWCGNCVQRVHDMEKAAISKARGE
jgi:hypothetical protein